MFEAFVTVSGAACQVLLAGTLVFAALSKVPHLRQFQHALRELGVGEQQRVRAVAGSVIAVEFVTGVALLVLPASAWPRAAVAGLAVAFAVAGVKAMRTERRIACHCFGNLGRGLLGRRQLALLPVWAVLLLIAQWRPPTWTPVSGLVVLTCLLAALTFAQLPVRIWRYLREERLAIREPPEVLEEYETKSRTKAEVTRT